MRLDHLLSKEELVRVGLLLICQGSNKEQRGKRKKEVLLARFERTSPSCAEQVFALDSEMPRQVLKTSGGDALKGHTRSHPEHDG